MATSGYKTIAATAHIDLKFSWEREDYSIADNNSIVAWKLQLISKGGNINSSAAKDWAVTVNGTKYSGTNTIGISTNSTKTLASGKTTIKHNTDGSKTFSFSFSQELSITYSGSWVGTKSGNGTGTLDTIPRASAVSCGSGDIESAVKITINKAVSSFTHTLRYTFGDLSGTIATKTSNSSINWTLPASFYEQMPKATSKTGTITCDTYSGNTKVGTKTCSFTARTNKAKCAPTISPTVIDTGSVSTTLTGDNSKFIKGYNSAKITMGVAAKNSAAIVSKKVVCGSKSLTADGYISHITSNTLTFTATDSRGYTTTKTVTVTMINYVELSCNLTAAIALESETTAKATITVKGNCYNGSLGATANTLAVEYRYKENSGEYSEWTPLTVTKSGNTYTATEFFTGLDYTNAHTFQARATDAIRKNKTTDEKTVRALPVFDWSKEDFNFNVPVFIQGRRYALNKELWSGGHYMNAEQTATLNDTISNQPNGIVLVWSYYNKEAKNSDFTYQFIPKYHAAHFNGAGVYTSNATCGMCKYVLVYDNKIVGHSMNTGSGNRNGLTYNNDKFVLRAVIGV